jgi:mycofactocin radical SAM maturase
MKDPDLFAKGLSAPVCLTWELTYACNLACSHCLSSSGRRDPNELSTVEAEAVVDELTQMSVFYVNIGGGEPTLRQDFWHLLEYTTAHGVGVKFSTNGSRITKHKAEWLAARPDIDVQVSIDGASRRVNDAVRGRGTYETAVAAVSRLHAAGVSGFKLSVVATRDNVGQLDDLQRLADRYGAQLRVTRLRPAGRGAESWKLLKPTRRQQVELHRWLRSRRGEVLTGDSFFHLSPLGGPLPGMNLCGAGRLVCLIDPVGDVYACPFAVHDDFLAGNVRSAGGFRAIWRDSPLFTRLRAPRHEPPCVGCASLGSCSGGCIAAKFFTGLPLEGPDPECVFGHGESQLASRIGVHAETPRPRVDHSRRNRSSGLLASPMAVNEATTSCVPARDAIGMRLPFPATRARSQS